MTGQTISRYKILAFLLCFVACSLQSCRQSEREEADPYPLMKVTFQVIPKVMPDSASIYISGRTSLLGNYHPNQMKALTSQDDSTWTKTFFFPRELKVRYTFHRDSKENSAVDETGNDVKNPVLYVQSDTTIIIFVENWKDLAAHQTWAQEQNYLGLKYENKAYLFSFRSPERITWLLKAARLFEQQENWESATRCYHKVGGTLNSLKKNDEALSYFRKSLAIASNELGENTITTGEVYKKIGVFYESTQNYEMALNYYQQAAGIMVKNGEVALGNLAWIYSQIASIFESRGELDKARSFTEKALLCLKEYCGSSHSEVAQRYKALANYFSKKGRHTEAIAHFEKALFIQRKCYKDSDRVIGFTYRDFAKILLQARELELAEKYLLKTLPIWHQFYGFKNFKIYESYTILAEIYRAKNDFERCIASIQKSFQGIVPEFENLNIYTNPPLDGSTYPRSLLDALAFKAKIFEEWAAQENQEWLIKSRFSIRKKLDATLAAAELATRLATRIRATDFSESAKLYLTGTTKEIHERAIRVAFKLHDLTGERRYLLKAFEVAEAGKASILEHALQEVDAKRFSGVPGQILADEEKIRTKLASLETSIAKEKTKKSGGDQDKIKKLENEYFLLDASHRQMLDEIESKYPRFFELKYSEEKTAVPDLQTLLDEHTALIEYFLGDSALYIFAISKTSFDVATRPLDDDFERVVKNYFASLKRVLENEKFYQYSALLYDRLIQPIEEKIKAKEKLVIIPDGILHYIPFESLVRKNDELNSELDFRFFDYLINDYKINYHYSATLYRRSRFAERLNDSEKNMMAFAPIFRAGDRNGYIWENNRSAIEGLLEAKAYSVVTRSGDRFEALEYSENEVRAILELFDTENEINIGFFHDAASEQNFKSNAGKYKHIHVSTHGFMNEEQPALSGLAFSQLQDSTTNEDGILYAAEAYNLDLNADLVVLSSCESGVGKLAKGEGMLSLTRGFLYSGARNVVVSLWKVFDEHTSRLMIEFYKGIVAGKSYAAALREAKLKMITDEKTAFPASWASFVLVGE